MTQLQSAAESAESNNSAQKPAAAATAKPTNFREAEVLGLRYMQDGRYEEALKGEFSAFVC